MQSIQFRYEWILRQAYTTALNKYINIGCNVEITELDISVKMVNLAPATG